MAVVTVESQIAPAAEDVRASPRVPQGPGLSGAPAVALVVEPDTALREGIAAALRARGMVVDQAADGLGALFSLAQRTPHFIVLDMDLREVSGHRVFQVLRQDPETRRAPVLMLSAASLQEVCPRATAGALPECFLQKPVTPDAVVRELVRTGGPAARLHG
jgi:CheY-like chemotaxis protein